MAKAEKIQTSTSHMQANYLKDRIDAAKRKGNTMIHQLGRLPESKEIKAAKALISKFEKADNASQERTQRAARARLESVTQQVRQDVLFGDPTKALKAVADYEQHVATKYAP